jgi:hypothetical protein
MTIIFNTIINFHHCGGFPLWIPLQHCRPKWRHAPRYGRGEGGPKVSHHHVEREEALTNTQGRPPKLSQPNPDWSPLELHRCMPGLGGPDSSTCHVILSLRDQTCSRTNTSTSVVHHNSFDMVNSIIHLPDSGLDSDQSEEERGRWLHHLRDHRNVANYQHDRSTHECNNQTRGARVSTLLPRHSLHQ